MLEQTVKNIMAAQFIETYIGRELDETTPVSQAHGEAIDVLISLTALRNANPVLKASLDPVIEKMRLVVGMFDHIGEAADKAMGW